ncbi:MAG: lysophospholipase [Proteobacteria bacterium]|nr:lysophospholipase [Pseudomonadota bacterium]
MRIQSGLQASAGGGEIYVQSWLPEQAPRGVVVLVHGLAEHCGRYGELVERLTGRGLAVYAMDHRGHGRSPGPRAMIGRFRWLVEDVQTRLEVARGAHPGLPLFLLGHSMGGAIALETALSQPVSLAGLVLSAPALGADPAVPALQVAIARLLSRVAPSIGVLRLPADAISRDPLVVGDYERDPLVYRGSIPARTAVELLQAMRGFTARAAALRVPTLVLHGTADRLVPIAQAESVWRTFGSADFSVQRYEGLYHEVFNEPERARVQADLQAWLEARL